MAFFHVLTPSRAQENDSSLEGHSSNNDYHCFDRVVDDHRFSIVRSDQKDWNLQLVEVMVVMRWEW